MATGDLRSDEGEVPVTIELDRTDPKVQRWLEVLDHIKAAMALVNENDATFAALSQTKQSAEKHLGAVLLCQGRAAIRARQSGTS